MIRFDSRNLAFPTSRPFLLRTRATSGLPLWTLLPFSYWFGKLSSNTPVALQASESCLTPLLRSGSGLPPPSGNHVCSWLLALPSHMSAWAIQSRSESCTGCSGHPCSFWSLRPRQWLAPWQEQESRAFSGVCWVIRYRSPCSAASLSAASLAHLSSSRRTL